MQHVLRGAAMGSVRATDRYERRCLHAAKLRRRRIGEAMAEIALDAVAVHDWI